VHDQFTNLLPVPDTIAANCCVVPANSELEFGLTAIEMFLFGPFAPKTEGAPSKRIPIRNKDFANRQTAEWQFEASLTAFAFPNMRSHYR
jgi:hypothetical protein